MATYHLPAIIEKDEEGYFGYCPLLQGCDTQADTYEDVLDRLKDAIRLHLEDRIAAVTRFRSPSR